MKITCRDHTSLWWRETRELCCRACCKNKTWYVVVLRYDAGVRGCIWVTKWLHASFCGEYIVTIRWACCLESDLAHTIDFTPLPYSWKLWFCHIVEKVVKEDMKHENLMKYFKTKCAILSSLNMYHTVGVQNFGLLHILYERKIYCAKLSKLETVRSKWSDIHLQNIFVIIWHTRILLIQQIKGSGTRSCTDHVRNVDGDLLSNTVQIAECN